MYTLYPKCKQASAWCSEIGIRFHPTRGAMSLGESKGGLPPDSCTEDEDLCLKDMERCIKDFHDNSRSDAASHCLQRST